MPPSRPIFFLCQKDHSVSYYFLGHFQVFNFLERAQANEQFGEAAGVKLDLEIDNNLEKVHGWGLLFLHILKEEPQILVNRVLDQAGSFFL